MERNSAPSSQLHCFVEVTTLFRSCILRLKLQPRDKVEKIFQKIENIVGFPLTDQLLLYNGWQLEPNYLIVECKIKNQTRLHLVSQRLKEEHPYVWGKAQHLVSLIHKLVSLEGDDGWFHAYTALTSEWTSQTFVELNFESIVSEATLTSTLSIYLYLCIPPMLMLYVSQNQLNKDAGEKLIREFVSSCGNGLDYVCAPTVLMVCKMLGRSGAQADPLYTFCINTLGMMVNDIWVGTGQIRVDEHNNQWRVIALKDLFPIFRELANKLLEGSHTNFSPSELEAFVAFLRSIKNTVHWIAEDEGKTPINMAFAITCGHQEVSHLHTLFLRMVEKMIRCLQVVKAEMEMVGKEDGEWDQYLVIMKELHSIATLYDLVESWFWSNLKPLSDALRYLIVTYAKRGEDHEWLIGHKDLLDFECRRRLVMLMFPDTNDEGQEPCFIYINRSRLLEDSFETITTEEPKYLRGELIVEFDNEKATGPGVLREWLLLVCKGIFKPDNDLFIACPNDPRKFFPGHAASKMDLKHKHFKFAGRVVALALMHSIQVGIMFDRTFFLQLAGIDMSLEDIIDADPVFYSSCKQILDMDPVLVDEDALGLTFVHEFKELGSTKVVELLPDGKNIVVNSENRHEYVQLLVKHLFVISVSKQVAKFAKGFADIVGNRETHELVFRTLEFEDYNRMLYGSESIICVEDWKAHTEYQGYTAADPHINWFWKVVEEMPGAKRSTLLSFWTALLYLPVEGFAGIDSKLQILKSNNSIDHLPTSNTCFYNLNFPPYPSLEVMRERLDMITNAKLVGGFGVM